MGENYGAEQAGEGYPAKEEEPELATTIEPEPGPFEGERG